MTTPRKSAADFWHIELKGYQNINKLHISHDQLHCCETLFGDYNAELMVLAQDPANFASLQKLKVNGYTNPYRHSPTLEANINLFNLISPYFDVGDTIEYPETEKLPKAGSCGVYYANAIWLLKEGKNKTVKPPSLKKAFEKCRDVFSATLENLPKLKMIITLGQPAYDCLREYSPDFRQKTAKKKWCDFVRCTTPISTTIQKRDFLVSSIYHPGKLGLLNRCRAESPVVPVSNAKGFELTKGDTAKLFAAMDIPRRPVR